MRYRGVALALTLWLGALTGIYLEFHKVLIATVIFVLLIFTPFGKPFGKALSLQEKRSLALLIFLFSLAIALIEIRSLAVERSDIPDRERFQIQFQARGDSDPTRSRTYGSERSRPRCSLMVEIEAINSRPISIPFRAITEDCSIFYGERIVARGYFVPKSSDEEKSPSSEKFLIVESIEFRESSTLWRSINQARIALRTFYLNRAPHSALVPGMVIGDTSLQSEDLELIMRRVGLAHLTAVSGTNFAIVAAFLLNVSSLLFRRINVRVVITLISLVLFGLLVRPTPSVLRAGVMATVFLYSKIRGDRREALAALATAVSILLLIDPYQARDLGFTLSVLATAGLLILTPLITEFLHTRARIPRLIAELIAIPAGATIFCTPVVVGFSGEISLATIPINIAVAPFVPLVTILGFLNILLAPISAIATLTSTAASLAAWPIYKFAYLGLHFPFFHIGSGVIVGLTAAFITLALLLYIFSHSAFFLKLRERFKYLPFILLLLLLAPVFLFPQKLSDWRLYQCDVGQGDALLIRIDRQSAMAIDLGGDPEKMDRCLQRAGVKKLSLIAITHFHADHVAGLTGALRARQVGQWWIAPESEKSSDEFERAQKLIGTDPIVVRAGDVFAIGEVKVSVLWPKTGEELFPSYQGDGSILNNRSLVLLVESLGVKILVTGDIEPPVQEILSEIYELDDIEIYKVSHHGSKWRSERFDQELRPKIALISVGAKNSYGHPAPETLEKLLPAKILRTDLAGDIAITWWPWEIRTQR